MSSLQKQVSQACPERGRLESLLFPFPEIGACRLSAQALLLIGVDFDGPAHFHGSVNFDTRKDGAPEGVFTQFYSRSTTADAKAGTSVCVSR
ncbi:hypothetical protein D3869_15915 (plasmid) [Azospirillum brasilense]|uniref:Uncharacterized protein n=1 Tax=Azospirillum brasilense TaxID=192 RepID=A0A4D8RBE5_AZOBR|nr:hypothetical protein [Azospirillum brasilense]QCO16789.1 hypothetical protein D3869_15915 [Azospirillum brasilense]